MAKLGAPIQLPFEYFTNGHFDSRLYDELWKWVEENYPRMLYFPRGDGYALYAVDDKYVLHHIPFGDAWAIDEYTIRGLRKKDIDELLRRAESFKRLFNR